MKYHLTTCLNESGNFKENFLLTNEINTVEIYAKDKFGKETRERLTLVYKGKPVELNISSTTEEMLEALDETSTEVEIEEATSTEGF